MTCSIQLRDYQKEALNAVIAEHQTGINRQIISLPTGSGKTVLMAAIAKHFDKKTLLIAHREELIEQAKEKFKLFWPGVSLGICMADRDEIDNQVVVGSVQSCSRPKRLERLKEQGFEVMMIDEAHHSSADSYQNVINSLGFREDPKRLLVGVTATVRRGDQKGLDSTFQKITFSRSISTMIKAGYLSNVEGRRILTNLTFDRIRSQNGDFNLEDLAEAVNTPERNAFIVEKFAEYAATRKAIAFCVDVAHCQKLAEEFRKNGIKAAAVWGDMETDKRKQALTDFKLGFIQVVTSCGILCEGYDETSVDCVLMCRPTKSQSLYIQCVGRGLRLHPGKANCLVIDFTDKGHNLDSVLNLSSAIHDLALAGEKEGERPEEEIDHTRKMLILDERDERFDILGNARFTWIDIGDNEWSLIDDDKNEIVMQPHPDGYIALLYAPDFSSRPIVKTPLPLEYCFGVCEDYARRHLKIAFADLDAPWMSSVAVPTQGQRDYLERQGAYRPSMTKAQASIEIRKIIAMKNKQRRLLHAEPITPKQFYALKHHGIDPTNMSKLDAMKAIGKLKQKAVNY